MELYTLAALPIILLVLWTYTALMAGSLPNLTGKRILFLIAHPDDEAMFFAPSLLNLARPELGNQVKILCLSNGQSVQPPPTGLMPPCLLALDSGRQCD